MDKTVPDMGPVQSYDATRPWNRQPCDNDAQWAAFRQWLTAPLPRNIVWLASKCEGITAYQLQRWRERFGWDARAEAFDAFTHSYFQDRVTSYVDEHAKDYAERHIKLLVKAGRLAANELDKYLRASEGSPGIGLLTAKEVITLLEMAIKLERLIRGEATENVQNTVDLSALAPNDLIQLRRLQLKAGVR